MPRPRTLKVRIPITVEIDVDTWCDEYGYESAAAGVRAEVKLHVENTVRQHLGALGVLAE